MSDENDMKSNLSSTKQWFRFLYMLIFALVLYAAILVTWVVVAIQFIFTMFTGSDHPSLRKFCAAFSTFVYQIIRFLTYNTEEKPFPFSDWPDDSAMVKAPGQRAETSPVASPEPEPEVAPVQENELPEEQGDSKLGASTAALQPVDDVGAAANDEPEHAPEHGEPSPAAAESASETTPEKPEQEELEIEVAETEVLDKEKLEPKPANSDLISPDADAPAPELAPKSEEVQPISAEHNEVPPEPGDTEEAQPGGGDASPDEGESEKPSSASSGPEVGDTGEASSNSGETGSDKGQKKPT